jgi:uncharacterized protein involved in response to NO
MTRDAGTPPLLRLGFRPFFLAAALWAVAAMALWLPIFRGDIALPTAFDPVAWHVHEMLFGTVAAVVAGFLLTAIPNWTGRLPLRGAPLGGPVALWLAGRAAVAFSAPVGPLVAGLVDLAFLATFLALVAREIIAGRNWRNLPMPAALALLLAANVLMHAEAIGLAATGATGQRLAVATIVALIGLVGGRVVPSFTRNWLTRRGETKTPPGFGAVDRAGQLALVGALLLWVAIPDSAATGAALIVAGLATLARLARWRGHRTLAEPLVWSLHLGYAWLPVGLVLSGLAALPPYLPAVAGLHALTAGAMGAMTLAVMTRASLGHSGRALAADRITTAIYVLVHAGALLRVAAPFVDAASLMLLWTSAAAWAAAFGLFVVGYGRLLLTPGKR